MKQFLLGAHMPIAGGFPQAAVIGKQVGCSAIQIFTKSNRQWHAKPIASDEGKAFQRSLAENNIAYVNAHASYLINLCASEQTTASRSTAALETELIRCHELGIQDLVLHPGAKKEQSLDSAIKKFATNLNTALSLTPKNTRILIESMAGQGSVIGSTLEELAAILEMTTSPSRVGICIDTCHIFAAGYDFCSMEKYHEFWKSFNHFIGIDKLHLIHLNDSKKTLGARVDRHEHIGEGQIGKQALRLIMNDSKLIDVPKILETPKENLDADAKNLQLLVNLLDEENRKRLKNSNLEIYLS